MIKDNITYNTNPNLKKTGITLEFSAEQIEEYTKCSADCIYFIENYVKIITLDHGLQLFKPREYQKKMIRSFLDNRFTISKMPRQSGKSTVVVAYFLWVVLFHADQNIAIVANRGDLARILLSKIRLAYEYLPLWMQQGVVEWNKGNIQLENNSKIVATASVRGESYNILFVDEFAHINNSQAHDFFSAAYPTISSGTTSKLIIVSTPKGLNHFYKLWIDAEEKKNLFIPLSVHWSDIPGRDEEWKKQEIANTSEDQFLQEQECDFVGSANTLILPRVLRNIPFFNPIRTVNGLDIYKEPIPKHEYIIVADTSHGVGMDNSAFVVIDITDMPYEIVAKYKSNDIPPIIYPDIISTTAKQYNWAYVLLEINDVGTQVADILYNDLEYENIFFSSFRGRAGQVVGNFGGTYTNVVKGVKTTHQVKSIGCANLKTIIENEQLIVNDFDVISELSNFIKHKNTYAADIGQTDDLVMCLVLFSWLIKQEYFKSLTSTDFRKQIRTDQKEVIEEELLPFGFMQDGMIDTSEEVVGYDNSDRWLVNDVKTYDIDRNGNFYVIGDDDIW